MIVLSPDLPQKSSSLNVSAAHSPSTFQRRQHLVVVSGETFKMVHRIDKVHETATSRQLVIISYVEAGNS